MLLAEKRDWCSECNSCLRRLQQQPATTTCNNNLQQQPNANAVRIPPVEEALSAIHASVGIWLHSLKYHFAELPGMPV